MENLETAHLVMESVFQFFYYETEEMGGDKTQEAKLLPNKRIGILNVSPDQLT